MLITARKEHFYIDLLWSYYMLIIMITISYRIS